MESKIKGVSADMMSSSHPICNNVKKSSDAEALFDGISYGKGAAVLKQLHVILGQEGMKRGLNSYFNKFQWGNSELSDFVSEMQNAYNKGENKVMGDDFNLKVWGDTWLTTSGINTLVPMAEYNSDNTLKSLAVKQQISDIGSN